MKITEKSFVNPLLAQAFIEGVSFSNNINLTCRTPRKDSPTKWVVIIENEEKTDDVESTTKTKVVDNSFKKAETEVLETKKEIVPKYPCGECIGCAHRDVCSKEVNDTAILQIDN